MALLWVIPSLFNEARLAHLPGFCSWSVGVFFEMSFFTLATADLGVSPQKEPVKSACTSATCKTFAGLEGDLGRTKT